MNLKLLITEEKVRQRVKELAEEISEAFQNSPITVISVLKGATVFTADLIRSLRLPVELDFLIVKSYRGQSKEESVVLYRPQIPIKGKNVLIVDDIFDTGESLELVYREVLKLSPTTLKTCVLLDKEVEKKTEIKPDFVGFKVPDRFIVGYGLDLDEKFRELPYIAYVENNLLRE